jgi:uncharacterized protein with von Willebrand factor type A (vWA) domain
MASRLWKSQIESAFEADRFDLREWLRASDAMPDLIDQDAHAAEEFCGHPVQDAFLSIFAPAPQLRTPPPEPLAPLADLLQRGMETPGYQQLRTDCRGDHVASGVGAVAFTREVLATLDPAVKEQARQAAQTAQDAQDAQQTADALQDLLTSLQDLQHTNPNDEALQDRVQETSEALDEAQKQAAHAAQEAADASEALDEARQHQRAQIAAAINNAATDARREAKDASDMVRGFSEAAGGTAQFVDPATAQAAFAAFRKNPNLADLADMLGWARRVTRAAWRQSLHARTEMVGYRAGALNMAHMAPSEWVAYLSDSPALRADWERRAAENAVLHRHFEGRQQQGRGPMIVVRDESGSMAGAPHAMSVAVEWALLDIARRDDRPFWSIPFAGPNRYRVWQAPDTPDPQGLADHLGRFFGGATEPFGPLREALQLIEDTDKARKADILIISDGVFQRPVVPLPPHENTHIVALAGGYTAGALRDVADTVILVDSLVRDKRAVADALAQVV